MTCATTVWLGGREQSVTIEGVDTLVYRRPAEGLPRTLLHTQIGEAVLTDGCRTVAMRSDQWWRELRQYDVPIDDIFDRVRDADGVRGWGIARAGGSWQHSGGKVPDDYTVPERGRGALRLTSANVSRHAWLGSYNLQDQRVGAAFRPERDPSGSGGVSYGVTWCRQDAANHYRARVNVAIKSGKRVATLVIQKDVDSVLTTLASVSVPPPAAGAYQYVEATQTGSALEARVWEEGTERPEQPTVTADDGTYLEGRSGLLAFIGSNEPETTVSVKHFYAWGAVVSPVTVSTDQRVYALTDPHDGSVDLDWEPPAMDAIDHAMSYIYGAPESRDGGILLRGDAHYGPRSEDGSLNEGADWNDYSGETAYYADGTKDEPEPDEEQCLDCSGYMRRVWGPKGMGLPVGRTSKNDGNVIPRVSYSQVEPSAPGKVVIKNTGHRPKSLDGMQVGDIIGFDADETDAKEGQIDHVGMFIGYEQDSGEPLFISSRKGIDGPTFSASSGSSSLVGDGHYAQAVRTVKRF